MYKNYAEYISNRKQQLEKLSTVFPQLNQLMPILNKGLELSSKFSKHFDLIKKGMEKTFGKEMEYGEVDQMVQMLSTLAIQDNMDDLIEKMDQPEEATRTILVWLNKSINAGFTDDMIKEIGDYAKDFANTVNDDE